MMNVEEIREYALSLDDVQEGFPFGTDTLVFKSAGKMFLLVALSAVPLRFNVKCDPDKAVELRERYSCVLPGYHMNKANWNTIVVDGQLSAAQLRQMILDSCLLVSKRRARN